MKVDLTVVAIPAYFAAMGAEYRWLRTHPPAPGSGPRAGDYQRADTLASLTMGVGSLLAPYVATKVLDPVTPGKGRFGRALLGVAAGAAALTTVADVVARRRRTGRLPEPGQVDGLPPLVRRAHAGLAVTAVASTSLAAATTWATATSGQRLFARSPLDLGTSRSAWAAALVGWDFLYYWNHRLSHESRWLWAVHVVHHSSERYNLSTALRQPVAESLAMTVPYGLLALAGVRPALIEQARAINLIYQFWVHTETIRSIGRFERVLNSPSHHRVHHGSNRRYLDRNHGGILIVWDKLFGTFEPEGEPVVYGLTRNIDTYDPVRIATHEWRDIAADVASASTWRDRWSYLLRGPGWAYARRAAAS